MLKNKNEKKLIYFSAKYRKLSFKSLSGVPSHTYSPLIHPNNEVLNNHPRDGEGQGSMTCCSSWGCKELDTNEGLNKNDNTDFSQLATQGGRAKITKISSRFFTQ